MIDTSQQSLLERYRETGDASILDEIIRQNLALIYSAAVRQVHDRTLAEDVAQAVCIRFFNKARTLSPNVQLEGWLFQTTRYEAANIMRSEHRRQRREKAASRTETSPSAPETTWDELSPHLDEAMARLSSSYRQAVLLRFLKGLSFSQVGESLGVTEEAARKLVTRGIEKLRGQFAAMGLSCTEAGLATLLSENAIESVPARLTTWTTAAAHSAASAAAPTGMTKLTGTILAMGGAKLAAAVLIPAAVITGTAAVVSSTSRSGPAAAAPAPSVSQKIDRAAETQALRNTYLALQEAVAAGDVNALDGLLLSEDPEMRPAMEICRQAILKSTAFKQAVIKRFGALPQDIQQVTFGGTPQSRRDAARAIAVTVNNDGTAIVQEGPKSVVPVIHYKKIEGKWMFMADPTLKQKTPDGDTSTDRLRMVLECHTAAIKAIEDGSCQTMAQLREILEPLSVLR